MKVDFAIITIREDEFAAVLQRFRTKPRDGPGGRTYGICQLETKTGKQCLIAIARCSEQGNDISQQVANDIINDLDPQILLVVGIAGGVPHSEFTLGDVIISTRIHNFDLGARNADGTDDFDVRGGIHPLISNLTANLLLYEERLSGWNDRDSIGQERPDVDLQRAIIYGNNVWRRKVQASLNRHFGKEPNQLRLPKFKTGSIASSNSLIKDPLRLIQWIKNARSILAVEMESAGVYEAAGKIHHQYPVMAIRGISDIVGLERDEQWTAYACHTAAAFAYAFIRVGLIDPRESIVDPKPPAVVSAPNSDKHPPQGSFVNRADILVNRPSIFMVADLPVDFVPRPSEFEAVKRNLLGNHRERPIAISAALQGAGGYGKTTLAQAICHDSHIQATFPGGILWVTLGEKPGNLLGKVEDLIFYLSHERPGFTSIEAASTWLRDLLKDTSLLMVIDDVWQRSDLDPFLLGGQYSARLITTRNDAVLPSETERIQVDAMRQEEAVQLLCKGLDIDEHFGKYRQILNQLAKRLGEWPLLLALANGVLRERVNHYHQKLSEALAYLQKAMDKRGILAFDAKNPQARKDAVARTLEVSLSLLNADEYARYQELVVFPEDVAIPLATLYKFWYATGGLDEVDTEELCQRLHGLSLLRTFDIITGTIQLHDVLRGYLQVKFEIDCPALHRQLLDTYGVKRWADLSLDEPYLWKHLAFHLIAAGYQEVLVDTVKDLRYLATKAFLCSFSSIEADLDLAQKQKPLDGSLLLLERQIINMGHLLNRSETLKGVSCTLLSRLCHVREISNLCRAFENEIVPPLLKLWHPLSKLHFASLGRTLQGHRAEVLSCAASPDGDWIVSASDDKTLKIWDVRTGVERLTLQGHQIAIYSCAVSPDGNWVVSASADGILKIWDACTGAERLTLQGHQAPVTSCAISPDGDWIVSASADRTLKIWDVRTGAERLTLQGHQGPVIDCAVSPDGDWVVSASHDKTLKIWDVRTGTERFTLQGHKALVANCAVSPDGGWIVSASGDHTLKIWDAHTRMENFTLQDHTAEVIGCAVTSDGRWIISASDDHTLKVWDVRTGTERLTLQGHQDSVTDCAVSPDSDWIVSASDDETLKIWDVRTGLEYLTLKGHQAPVMSCAVSPDGDWIVSASWDDILKIWDVRTGLEYLTLRGHTGTVRRCRVNPNGEWVVSASWDESLKVWDSRTGVERLTLKGHKAEVNDCAVSPDGSLIISASWDCTLKVWDAQNGSCLITFYTDEPLFSCAFHPDGEHLVAGGLGSVYFLCFIK